MHSSATYDWQAHVPVVGMLEWAGTVPLSVGESGPSSNSGSFDPLELVPQMTSGSV